MHGMPKQVQVEYRKKFGRHATTPTRKSIHNWWSKMFETGSVNRRKKVKTRWIRTELTEAAVLAKLREDEHASTRSVGRQEGMPSPCTIQRILKHAETQMRMIENDGEFLSNLLFSDESHFHLHGHVNHHCFHYWFDGSPQWYQEQPLHSPRVSVWAAIGMQGIAGLIFIDGNVTGEDHF
uniref:DUF4817 domain-containing protein n=1 Tax=Ditylenchus dipsaci TaxID=166011 RepID=A0A915EBH7_9BILA